MRLRRPGLWLWHPLAFSAWPVLNLYRDNIGETPPGEAVIATAISVAAAAVVLAVLVVILRDPRRAALITSVMAFSVLFFGAIRDATDEASWLLPAWLAATVVLVGLVSLIRRSLREFTIIAAGMATIVLLMALVPIIRIQAPAIAATRDAQAATDLDAKVGQWSAGGEPRDIYYLIFDRYGAQTAMEQRWEMDLEPFFSGLERRGFDVTPDSKANHLRTAQSLASSLNLQYLFDLAERYGPNTGNLLPIYDRLRNHAVGRILKDRGYEYAHVGAWWDPTQENPQADLNLGYETRSDFELAYFRSTLLSVFEDRPEGVSLAEQSRMTTYRGALSQFEQIAAASQREGPTFTFGHILLPHEPFVFDIDGNYVTREQEGERGRRTNYIEQTLYTNKLIESLLDQLLAVPEDERPIIILQADEGPHPVRFKADEHGFNWHEATDAELEEKLAILNAYYLPGIEDPGLYDSISPVNTWRVVFNSYFGADLPLLEDRSFVFRDQDHAYDFVEVTDRLGKPIVVP